MPIKLNISLCVNQSQDYMPMVFRAVRGLSGIEEADYMMSLAGEF